MATSASAPVGETVTATTASLVAGSPTVATNGTRQSTADLGSRGRASSRASSRNGVVSYCSDEMPSGTDCSIVRKESVSVDAAVSGAAGSMTTPGDTAAGTFASMKASMSGIVAGRVSGTAAASVGFADSQAGGGGYEQSAQSASDAPGDPVGISSGLIAVATDGNCTTATPQSEPPPSSPRDGSPVGRSNGAGSSSLNVVALSTTMGPGQGCGSSSVATLAETETGTSALGPTEAPCGADGNITSTCPSVSDNASVLRSCLAAGHVAEGRANCCPDLASGEGSPTNCHKQCNVTKSSYETAETRWDCADVGAVPEDKIDSREDAPAAADCNNLDVDVTTGCNRQSSDAAARGDFVSHGSRGASGSPTGSGAATAAAATPMIASFEAGASDGSRQPALEELGTTGAARSTSTLTGVSHTRCPSLEGMLPTASSMISNCSQFIDHIVTVVLADGEEDTKLTGRLFCYDPGVFKSLILKESLTQGPTGSSLSLQPSFANIHIIKLDQIRDIISHGISGEACSGGIEQLFPSEFSIGMLEAREANSLSVFERRLHTIGVGVTQEAQDIFDFIHKTHPDCHWGYNSRIQVMGITVSPPYGPENCSGEPGKPLDRIQQVILRFRERRRASWTPPPAAGSSLPPVLQITAASAAAAGVGCTATGVERAPRQRPSVPATAAGWSPVEDKAECSVSESSGGLDLPQELSANRLERTSHDPAPEQRGPSGAAADGQIICGHPALTLAPGAAATNGLLNDERPTGATTVSVGMQEQLRYVAYDPTRSHPTPHPTAQEPVYVVPSTPPSWLAAPGHQLQPSAGQAPGNMVVMLFAASQRSDDATSRFRGIEGDNGSAVPIQQQQASITGPLQQLTSPPLSVSPATPEQSRGLPAISDSTRQLQSSRYSGEAYAAVPQQPPVDFSTAVYGAGGAGHQQQHVADRGLQSQVSESLPVSGAPAAVYPPDPQSAPRDHDAGTALLRSGAAGYENQQISQPISQPLQQPQPTSSTTSNRIHVNGNFKGGRHSNQKNRGSRRSRD